MPRYYGRRRRFRRSRVPRGLPVGGFGFPREQMVRMRYCTNINLDWSGSVMTNRFFRLNSIFDPDYAVGGHQPMGYDEWEAFYNSYLVVWCKWSVYFNSVAQGTFTHQILAGAFPTATTTLPSTNVPTQFLERGLGSHRTLSAMVNNTGSRAKVSGLWSAKKWNNVSDIRDAVQLSAYFGANPEEECYLCIYAGNANGSAPSSCTTVQATLTLDYYVIVQEPRPLEPS